MKLKKKTSLTPKILNSEYLRLDIKRFIDLYKISSLIACAVILEVIVKRYEENGNYMNPLKLR